MLDGVLSIFGIEPHHDLNLMQHGQTLAEFAARALQSLSGLFATERPDVVVVQGDTTTAMAGALAAHYAQCRIAHVEAGLRSHDLRHPFPEEANRRIVSQLADLHFAPTEANQRNLLNEGVDPARVHVTGNTVIDALLLTANLTPPPELPMAVHRAERGDSRLILVTLHRRESFGEPLDAICRALASLVEAHPDVELLLPVHPNPNVRRVVEARLGGRVRVELVEPLGYREFVAAMRAAYFIITDSGGVQEEAPSLNRPFCPGPAGCDGTTGSRPGRRGSTRGREPSAILAAATSS